MQAKNNPVFAFARLSEVHTGRRLTPLRVQYPRCKRKKGNAAIKLVVCDMDGTLLNSRKELTQRTINTIRLAKEKGIFVTFCSGRVYSMLECYWRRAEIHGPVIASNGAHIVDTSSGRTLWESCIDPQAALIFVDFCRTQELDYSILCDDGCYFSPVSIRRERFVTYNTIAVRAGCAPIPLIWLKQPEDHRLIVHKKIHKILVYALRPDDIPSAKNFMRRCPELYGTSSEEGLLDISAPEISKGTALSRLAALMGLQREETCAFGDFENDIPMFEAAGLSIAMANGSEKARATADLITCSNDEDGVARGLEEYILGGTNHEI